MKRCADPCWLVGHPHFSDSCLSRRILATEATSRYWLLEDLQLSSSSFFEELTIKKRLVMLFPLYWYTLPSQLVRFLEDNASLFAQTLPGSRVLLIVTTGQSARSYSSLGHSHHPVSAFLEPLFAFLRERGASLQPLRVISRADARRTEIWTPQHDPEISALHKALMRLGSSNYEN